MGQYINFIEDFSGRCNKIYCKYYPIIKDDMNLEISFLLMFATTVFTIPNEKLKSSHPLKEERRKLKSKAAKYSKMLSELFIESELWVHKGEQRSWKYKEINLLETSNTIDIQNVNSWPKPEVISDQKLKIILGVIRNSLAHGNIYTFDEGKGIDNIRFISIDVLRDEKCMPINIKKISYIDVNPSDFKTFTESWVKFLNTNIENIKAVHKGFSQIDILGISEKYQEIQR